MTNPKNTSVLNFEPPNPGPWELDSVHYPRPVTRYFQDIYPVAYFKGSQDFSRFYGLLIDGIQSAYVHGFNYIQIVPVSEDEIPERFKRTEQVFEQKIWRKQLHDWDKIYKPASIAQHRAIQAIDPQTLSNKDLIAYLIRCQDHHAKMITQHLSYGASALLPVSDFLAQVGDMTALPHSELLELLKGASEISSGNSSEAERLKKALSNNPEALKLLESNEEPAEVLNYLRSLKNEAGMALEAYLDLIGNRLVNGFDIAEPRIIELPDAIIRTIHTTLFKESSDNTDVNEHLEQINAAIPEKQQKLFKELLQEARLVYRLRDEVGIYSNIWASGLMRRAVLEAGHRTANQGLIDNPLLMLDASLDEMGQLLSNLGGPSSDELRQRADYRATYTAKDAPRFIGAPKPPLPDLDMLPAPVSRLMRALFTALSHMFENSQVQNEEQILYGLAASKGAYEGPARCIHNPSEFGQIVKGDVLVTESTSEAFNILLPLLGGIITDNGGLLSHAAIVAREYGIPAVVGTCDATEMITNGVLVRVDGNTGEVTILQ